MKTLIQDIREKKKEPTCRRCGLDIEINLVEGVPFVRLMNFYRQKKILNFKSIQINKIHFLDWNLLQDHSININGKIFMKSIKSFRHYASIAWQFTKKKILRKISIKDKIF